MNAALLPLLRGPDPPKRLDYARETMTPDDFHSARAGRLQTLPGPPKVDPEQLSVMPGPDDQPEVIRKSAIERLQDQLAQGPRAVADAMTRDFPWDSAGSGLHGVLRDFLGSLSLADLLAVVHHIINAMR